MSQEIGHNPASPQNEAAKTPRAADTPLWFFILLSLLVCFAYILYTGHIWEDFLIAYRFSENLANGRGLTYNPGEKVYGFTSVIGIAIPAFFALFTQPGEFLFPLWAFRIASLAAFITGGIAIVKLLLHDKPRQTSSAWLFTILIVFSPILVAYTMNGMESGFMILFAALAFISGYKGYKDHWRLAALAWACLLYTRPDSVVVIAAAALCSLWDWRSALQAHFRGALKAAALTALAYLPWFIFTWIYFGSPIPHTITAKDNLQPFTGDYTAYMAQTITSTTPSMLQWAQMPIYASSGGWDWYWWISALIMGICAGFYWIWAGEDRLGSYASRLALIVAAYLAFINMRMLAFPWYFAPTIFFSAIALSRAIARFHSLAHPWVFRVLTAAVAARMAALFLLAATQIHFQQEVVENNVRIPVGLWLKQHAKPTDTVYLEPLGYIGYFSGLVMHDWPGLVSPTVVKLKRETNANRYQIIPRLGPDWLVLRPYEWEDLKHISSGDIPYQVVNVITQEDRLKQNPGLPGSGYAAADITFLILRRVQPGQ